ncbi:cysteine-rich repeat secretory protein 57-like [Brachypodium distachyon]|uniref:cysteine-rich repeat secretory protein 57-like n=1 Tax=Brachypodium distachyon TaxID=15368 RepID=UPI000D0DA193|nr:cysteine-rich repeat secretory protein 57-like [Brachypodium distachyon]|eukprot:XP_024316848.1 cysteine-rich repeat secretory protein 57-like [Brachypodium distachyon]
MWLADDASTKTSSAMIEAISCSTSGNYTLAGAYAANLNQFLAGLPENAVSKNGGFFNGTAGDGAATVYGLAMCFADYSRADCGECLVLGICLRGNHV